MDQESGRGYRPFLVSISTCCLVACICAFFISSKPIIMKGSNVDLELLSNSPDFLRTSLKRSKLNDIAIPSPRVNYPGSFYVRKDLNDNLHQHSVSNNNFPYWFKLEDNYMEAMKGQKLHSNAKNLHNNLLVLPSVSIKNAFHWFAGKNSHGSDYETPSAAYSVNDYPYSDVGVSWEDVSKIHSEVPRIQYRKTKAELENEKLASELAAVESTAQLQPAARALGGGIQDHKVSPNLHQPNAGELISADALNTAADRTQTGNGAFVKAGSLPRAQVGWRDIINMKSIVENVEKQLESTESENALLRQQLVTSHNKILDRSSALGSRKLHDLQRVDAPLTDRNAFKAKPEY